jgi:N-carbamoylputrescine amidase
VIAVNRTGFEPDPRGTGGIEFWGQSFIAAPDGRVIVRAPQDREAVLVAEIDLAEIDSSRAGWPFFRDRRVDAYADLTRRFGND